MRGRPASCGDQHRVVGSVEPAFELHDPAFAGKAAGKPDRGKRGLETGRDESEHLDRVMIAADPLRKIDLELRRRAVEPAGIQLCLDRLLDHRMRVTEKQGAVSHAAVDE